MNPIWTPRCAPSMAMTAEDERNSRHIRVGSFVARLMLEAGHPVFPQRQTATCPVWEMRA